MIDIYSKNSEFAILSNFAPVAVQFRGKEYPTAEHAFQAAKFLDTDPQWSEQIRQAETPAKAKSKGKSRSHPITAEWEEIKVDVMSEILYHKLADPAVESALRATGEQEIVEQSPWDYFWGTGKSGKGKNVLGKLWMSLRQSL